MIPSLHGSLLTFWLGPKRMPALAGSIKCVTGFGAGDRANTTRLLVPQLVGSGTPTRFGAKSYVSVSEPPLVGLPSTAYHWRSTGAIGVDTHVDVNVRPWLPERAVLKLARVRSAK